MFRTTWPTALNRALDAAKAEGYMTLLDAARIINSSPHTAAAYLGAPDKVIRVRTKTVKLWRKERLK
jgi:hypothetical protein